MGCHRKGSFEVKKTEFKEMKGSGNQAHLFVACFCLTFLDPLTVHKVQ